MTPHSTMPDLPRPWRGLAWVLGAALAGWIGVSVAEEPEEAPAPKAVIFNWDLEYNAIYKEWSDKQPKNLYVAENYQDTVDILLWGVGPDAPEKTRKDKPRVQVGQQMKFIPYYPNLMVGVSYYHLARFDQAKAYLESPNATWDGPNKEKSTYLKKIAGEASFIQGVELTLAEMDKFRKKGTPSAAALKKNITMMLDLVGDLETKDYDVTPWLDRAQQYTAEMKSTRSVLEKFKGHGRAPPPPQEKGKRKDGGRGPVWERPFQSMTASLSPLWQWMRPWAWVGALDLNHKMYKKYEDRMKRAAEKGDTEEALEDLTDALDFLDGAGADAADPKRVALEQKIASLKKTVGGPEAADPLAELLAGSAQTLKEAEGLLAGGKSAELRKAQDLLIGVQNKMKAALAGITDPARSAPVVKDQAAVDQLLAKVNLEIDDRILDLMRKAKAATEAVDQIKALKEVEGLNPDHAEMKAWMPKAYAKVDDEVNRLYKLGMNAYAEEKIEDAIRIWGQAQTLRKAAQMQEHKRLTADLAKAEQQYEQLFKKKPPKPAGG